MSPTTESILRILLTFMLIDGSISDDEKTVIMDFLKSKSGPDFNPSTVNLSKYKDQLTTDNFIQDLKKIYDDPNILTGDRFDIFLFIVKMIKADGIIHDREIGLFQLVTKHWNMPKETAKEYGISNSFWNKIFD